MGKFVYHVIQEKFIINKQDYVNVLLDKDGMDIVVQNYLNVLMDKNGMFTHIHVNVL